MSATDGASVKDLVKRQIELEGIESQIPKMQRRRREEKSKSELKKGSAALAGGLLYLD